MDFTHVWKYAHNNTRRPLSEPQVMVQFYLQLFWSLTLRHPQPGTHASVCAPPPEIFIELMDNNYTSRTGHRGGPLGKWCVFETNMAVPKRASYCWSDKETELCLFFFFNKRHNLMCLWEGKKKHWNADLFKSVVKRLHDMGVAAFSPLL